jgi:hypothetical protein
MSRHKKLVTLFTSLSIVLVGVLIGMGYFVLNNINQFTTYGNNTSVANVYAGGLYYNQVRSQLTTNAGDWRRTAEVTLVYQDYEMEVEPKIFAFNVPKSVDEIKDGQDNLLYVDINEEYKDYLSNLIETHQLTLKYSDFNLEQLKIDLISKVSKLYQTIKIDLGAYVNEGVYPVIASSTITSISSITNPVAFEERFEKAFESEIVIKGEKQFSLLKLNESLDETLRLTNGELSIIATGLYELILHTNFMNISKQTTEKIENYPIFAENKRGLEATINTSLGHDLTFYNPNAMNYYVAVSVTNDGVRFDLKGVEFIQQISVFGVDSTDIAYMEPQTVYIPTTILNGEELTPGEEIQYLSGIQGFRAIVGREITDLEGNVTQEIINEDIYMPRHNIFYKNFGGTTNN